VKVAVLKFGSSVLAGARDLERAVHEVYRERRAGRAVVAVVSAFAGRTERLLGQARRGGGGDAAAALLASTGELRSVALLALELERRGVPAAAFDAARLGLRAEGPALDARPVGLDGSALREALARHGTAVVPGFVACDERGATVLLGRGGSDLSALALAHALDAQVCRLLKDVDGVYDRDPARTADARRFEALDFAAARAAGGRVVQPKALEFAERVGRAFEVGACDGQARTLVGARASERAPFDDLPRAPLRVGLLGLGTVGLGVARALLRRPARFELAAVLVRDAARPREVAAHLLRERGRDVFAAAPDVLVETLGGLEPARTLVDAALERGIDVVSANKRLLARHADELAAAARRGGARLLDSAAVGGALPVLEHARALARGGGLLSVEGVLNGTSNAVLELVAQGATLADALAAAQRAGLAEADCTRDLDGSDVADKLVLLARAGFPDARPRWVERRGLGELDVAALRELRARGGALRLVGACVRVGDDVELSVAPRLLEGVHPLAELPGAANRVLFAARDGTQVRLDGLGAGREPTALSLLGDLLELSRERAALASEV
jgi:homoserine dehydrogenase